MTHDSPAPCPDTAPNPAPAAPAQPRNPLHGLTLSHIVEALQAHYGWAGLGERIAVRCFTHEPSLNASLKFLRKTPWARAKVESLYLFMLREQRRGGAQRLRPRTGCAPAQRESGTAASDRAQKSRVQRGHPTK